MIEKQPVETPREWLRFADENLRVAEHELTYEAPAYHTVLFPRSWGGGEVSQRLSYRSRVGATANT